MSKDNVLDKARELGNSIIQSIEFQNLLKAEDDFHNDIELLNNIKTFEESQERYNSIEYSEDEKKEYLMEMKKIEKDINENSTMKNLNLAKSNYEQLFKNINNLISYITGEDSRVSITQVKEKKGCGGCGGCSKK